jgi:hypothetical protein
MTTKRKAEIQRKLTLASIPRPPKDLAGKIKADIPRYLNAESERERFSRSIGFNLRIAASIIVLVSSLFAMLYVLNEEEPAAKSAADHSPVLLQREATPAANTAMDELRVDIVQQAAPVQVAEAAPPSVMSPTAAPAPRRERASAVTADTTTAAVESGIEGRVEGGIAGGIIGGTVGSAMASRDEDASFPPAAPEPAPVPPPAPAPAPVAAQAPRMAIPSLVSEAYAAELTLTPKSVFGLTVDPEVFRRIKSTIEKGGRPAPTAVNVEALVNYFAGAPARRVKRGVRLEVEASPAPVEVDGHRGILRFTIDTAWLDVPERGSSPAVAADARLEIELNSNAVSHFEPIGDSAPDTESALLYNTSVTGLYEVHLRAPLQERQTVATIRLSYRSIADNKTHTVVRVVRGADFAKPWARSSRRHRLASLGALWGESLRGSSGGTDVARRAEELASQAPADAKARELAEVAVASSGGTR